MTVLDDNVANVDSEGTRFIIDEGIVVAPLCSYGYIHIYIYELFKIYFHIPLFPCTSKNSNTAPLEAVHGNIRWPNFLRSWVLK